MATNYNINYEDERFTQVEDAKQEALNDVKNTYDGMLEQSDSYYQAQIDASKEWADKQQQLQQENTDFAIEQINQQKEQANKDYIKEQSGAYVDWQKQSNQYGANAEQMADSGLTHTGYSESSQVSMYNTYQNRVATARESYNKAILNYDNAIKDAQLQNNSKLAEIAYAALQQQLELSLQGFQYHNSLLAEQLAQKQAVDDRYYNRYQDVLAQMNQENALAEEIRQYNEKMAYQKQQDAQAYAQWQQEFNLAMQELAEEKRQYDANLKEEQRQFDIINGSSVTLDKANSAANKVINVANKVASAFGLNTNKTKGSNSTSINKTEVQKVSTYEEAVAQLKAMGFSGDGGLMTKSEWNRRKSNSKNGGSSSAETAYSSYEEYLNEYINYKSQNR